MNRARLWIQASDVERFKAAERLIAEAETVKLQVRAARGDGNRPPATVSASSSGPCGGSDYPPCYVAQRESGNRYDAYNPTGCGGSGCYGRWQFGGFWAGRLGLPADIRNATPAEQDAAARALWNGGRGCSNWAAC